MKAPASTTPDLADAPRLEGYKIVAECGRGGMGVVYKAIQEVLGRPVAIKAVGGGGAKGGGSKRLERLVAEARVVAGMANHENIVQVYDVARDDAGRSHIVMEHVEGQTLAERLFGSKGLPLAESARVVREAAMALQHAHDHGVIHRDVKLENIMLTPAGKLKVMDFGVALGLDGPASGEPGPMGTPQYMAPELLRDRAPADARSDVYALAVAFYYLAAGRLPFDEADVLAVVEKQVHEEPRRPSRFNPAIPPELERVIMRGLAKDPDERFDSAEIFAQEIQRAEGLVDLSKLGGPKNVFPPAVATGGARAAREAMSREGSSGRFLETASLRDSSSSSRRSSSRSAEVRLSDAASCPDAGMPGAPPTKRGAIKKFVLAVAGVVALLAAGALIFERVRPETPADPAATSLDAVAGLEAPGAVDRVASASHEPAPYLIAAFDFAVEGEPGGTSLGRELAAELANLLRPETARSLSRAELLRAMSLGEDAPEADAALLAAGADPARAAGIARLAGADAALVGAIDHYGARNLRARLVDASNGAIIGFAASSADDLDGLRARLPRLATELGSSLPGETAAPAALADPTAEGAFGRAPPYSEGASIPTGDPFVGTTPEFPAMTPDAAAGLSAPIDDGEDSRFLWHDGLVKSACFLPGDSLRVATASWDATASLWNVESGERLQMFIGHVDWVTGVAASSTEPLILTASRDNTARLWDVNTGKEVRRLVHDTSVTSVAFSPDGTLAMTGCFDRAARLWSVRDGKETMRLEGHSLPVLAVAFSPNGRLAATGSDDKTVREWDIRTGWSQATMLGHRDAVKTVAYSPDGAFIASGGKDQVAILWNASNGQEVRRFEGHAGTVWNLAFSPDGTRLLTGGHDRALILWDVASGRQLRAYRGHTEAVNAVAFAPNGRLALSGSGRGGLRAGSGFGEAILWNLPQ